MSHIRLSQLPVMIAVTGVLVLGSCGGASDEDNGGNFEPGPQPTVALFRAGSNSTCAHIEEEGTAFCWGDNEFGQLGDGTTTDRHRPTRVMNAPLYTPPLAGDHSCSRASNGLYCWGRNTSGEVGNGSINPALTPTLVTGGFVFQEVAVGLDFTCAIANSGVTYCWGANDAGQLGTGVPDNSLVPLPIAGNFSFQQIKAGGRTACGITTMGELFCWGNGADGELGNGSFGTTAGIPTAVQGGRQYDEVGIGANVAGQATVCGATAEGGFCWGKNSSGEIGDGTKVRKNIPTAVVGLPGSPQMAPAGSHTCARLPSGVANCWGAGGRLGTGNTPGEHNPGHGAGELRVLVSLVGPGPYLWLIRQ